MNTQTVTINLVPGMSTPAVVNLSQYDVGRPLTFKVYDGTATANIIGMTATVTGTKPSGLGFSIEGTVTANGIVSVSTTEAMTQESGRIPAEIRFTSNGVDVGTANFILAVEQAPHAEGTTDGTQETMQSLETRLQSQINGLDDRIETLEAGAVTFTDSDGNGNIVISF